jgi:predicted transcriptional regulator
MNDSSLSTSDVMLKAFLTYKQIKEYLLFLLQSDLIEHGDKERTFMITNKGLHFLKTYNRLPELFNKNR